MLDQSERDGRSLAHCIHTRTATLAAAKRHAEEMLASQNCFLASMSHELRTPLNAIIGFSEALISGAFGLLAERHVGYVTDIHHSGIHLLALVNDLLDIAAMDADKGVLEEAEVDLAKILDEIGHMLGPRSAVAGVSLENSSVMPSIKLLVDHRRLLQAMINIVSNAIKYTRQGGWVRLAAEVNSDGLCVISISDSGIGMSPDEIKVAMAPFGRAATPESRGIEGTGLGLPLAIRLIEAHGGVLTIDSMKGVGTTISMAIPACRVRG